MKLLERRSAQPAAYSARRSLTASAQRVNLRDTNEVQELNRASGAQWQDRAWGHYDSIGEVNFAYGLVANVMSRIRLYPAVVVDPDSPPVNLSDGATIERPEDEEDSTRNNNGISPQRAKDARDMWHRAMRGAQLPGIMRAFALNVSVPGECYLARIDNRWQLKSTSELKVDTSGVPKLYRTSAGIPKDLSKDTTIGRIWREHPRHSFEATSAMRALASDCEELLLLGRVIRSNSRARLNAGILYVPDEVTVASQTTSDEPEIEEDEADELEKMLLEALSAAATDEDSANTVVPLLFRGPTGMANEIKFFELGRKIDEFLVARADRTLERILQGLDVPKDIVTGLANVKYSNAIQIDESLYKAHVEPLALMIADAFTDIVLHPLLRAAGWDAEDVQKIVIWYDPSEVTTRPDRAADAQRLYDAKELSGSALRTAYGYSDQDKPSEDELATRVALSNIPPPELLGLLYQKALPSVLASLAKARSADQELPESLQSELSGTEMPNTDPGLTPSAPAAAPETPAPGGF